MLNAQVKKISWNKTVWDMLLVRLVIGGVLGGVLGGSLGGALGALTMYANFKIFKSDKTTKKKYILSALVTFLAISVFVTIVILLAHNFPALFQSH